MSLQTDRLKKMNSELCLETDISEHDLQSEQLPTLESGLTKLRSMGTSSETLRERADKPYLIDNLIQYGRHSIIYGESGVGKTTLAWYFTKEAMKKNDKLEVIYFLLDGADEIGANGIDAIVNDLDINNKVTVITDFTAVEIMAELLALTQSKADLSNTLFILDTYKKFQPNINDKGGNTEHLHKMRNLTTICQATILSLAHTNKDGHNASGTAELEQDSDALIRLDKLVHPDDDTMMTVTASKGGRVRWLFKPKSFSLPTHDPDPMKVNEVQYKDLSCMVDLNKRSNLITAMMIRDFLGEDNGDAPQNVIKKAIAEIAPVGENRIGEILSWGINIFWSVHRGEKNKYLYSVI